MQLALVLAQNKTGGLADKEYARLEKDLHYLDYLIEQMLMKSRASYCLGDHLKTWFSLDRALERLIENANFEANSARRTVVLSEATCCRYYGDEDSLVRAVENLIRNAIRFSPEHGTVRVGLTCDDHGVMIRVQESGPGVPESALPNLFAPFYRVSEQQGGDSQGTGLGLAIVKSAVDSHRGTVVARNTYPGLLVAMVLPWPKSELSLIPVCANAGE